ESATTLRSQLAAEMVEIEHAGDEAPTESQLIEAEKRARAAEESSIKLTRLRSELEGIEALRPSGAEGLRLRDVITPEAGYEGALSATLGPLLDAVVLTEEPAAVDSGRQVTILFPTEAPTPQETSLYYHATIREGYRKIAVRLLGQIVVGRDVTFDGV